MGEVMEWFWLILTYMGLTLAALAGLACVALTLLQLPGTWLHLLLVGVVTWLHGRGLSEVEIWCLALMLALAVLGEILEFIAGAIGSHQAGGTRRGAALAILGSIIGAIAGTAIIPIPIVGTVIGACVGAGAGSLLGDKWAGRQWKAALTSGTGAALGKLGGTIAKVAIAMVMWVVSLVALFVG